MTDEQRLQMITNQLILVRDNLFRGMSKSIQKLQARSINEVLELPSHTESPQHQLIDLDSSTGFTFSVEHGTFIGEVEMLKWLVENRSKDYWEHVAKTGEAQ